MIEWIDELGLQDWTPAANDARSRKGDLEAKKAYGTNHSEKKGMRDFTRM